MKNHTVKEAASLVVFQQAVFDSFVWAEKLILSISGMFLVITEEGVRQAKNRKKNRVRLPFNQSEKPHKIV